MKTWILLFCLLLASCGGRQAQFSDHEDFYWIDFRPLVKNEALEVGLNEWGQTLDTCNWKPTNSFRSNSYKGLFWTVINS